MATKRRPAVCRHWRAQTTANELKYTGDTNDSATMNVWLRKQTMGKLAVPVRPSDKGVLLGRPNRTVGFERHPGDAAKSKQDSASFGSLRHLVNSTRVKKGRRAMRRSFYHATNFWETEEQEVGRGS
jgi:Domain of unknown function (DUF3597)